MVNNVFFYNQTDVCCVLFLPQPQPRTQTEPKSDKSRPKTDRALTIHSKEVYNIFIICFRRDSSTILKIIYQNLALCNSNTIF
jgi:hypothetical protein